MFFLGFLALVAVDAIFGVFFRLFAALAIPVIIFMILKAVLWDNPYIFWSLTTVIVAGIAFMAWHFFQSLGWDRVFREYTTAIQVSVGVVLGVVALIWDNPIVWTLSVASFLLVLWLAMPHRGSLNSR